MRAISSTDDVHAWYQDGEINEADPVSPQLNIATYDSHLHAASLRACELHFDGMDNLSPYMAGELLHLTYLREPSGFTQEFWGPQDINDAGQPDQYVVWHVGN